MKYPSHLQPEILDDELTIDISEMSEGVSAFYMIREGYAILARVDDAENRRMHQIKATAAENKVAQVTDSLERARELAKNRKTFRERQLQDKVAK